MNKEEENCLDEKEVAWKLKSRAIWLEQGDEKLKKKHQYEKGRKNTNTI